MMSEATYRIVEVTDYAETPDSPIETRRLRFQELTPFTAFGDGAVSEFTMTIQGDSIPDDDLCGKTVKIAMEIEP